MGQHERVAVRQAGAAQAAGPRRLERARRRRCCRPRASSAEAVAAVVAAPAAAAARCCCSSCSCAACRRTCSCRRSSARSRRSTAEEKLTKADLKLDPNQKEQVDDKVAGGHRSSSRRRRRATKVEKGTPVAVLVAVGTGKVNVPDIVGQDRRRRRQGAAREGAHARPGLAAAGRPRRARSSRQIPAAGEVVKAGTPVNIFYRRPGRRREQEEERREGRQEGRRPAARGGGGGGGGGDEAAADIIVPAIGKDDTSTPTPRRSPTSASSRSSPSSSTTRQPGTLFATDPPGGTKVAPKSKVKVLVSVGQPQVIYTNGKNILRLNGANGAKLDPVATSPDDEARPDLGRRRRARRLHRRRARDAQGPHEEERGRGAAHAGRRASSPTSRGRRPPTAT